MELNSFSSDIASNQHSITFFSKNGLDLFVLITTTKVMFRSISKYTEFHGSQSILSLFGHGIKLILWHYLFQLCNNEGS